MPEGEGGSHNQEVSSPGATCAVSDLPLEAGDHAGCTQKLLEAKKELLFYITKYDQWSIVRIIDRFRVPESVLQSSEVQAAARERITSCLKEGSLETARDR